MTMSRTGALTNFSSQSEQFIIQLNLPYQLPHVKCEISQDNIHWEHLGSFIPTNQFPLIEIPKNLKTWTFKVTGLDENQTPICKATSSMALLTN
jgi:hypothetical protein